MKTEFNEFYVNLIDFQVVGFYAYPSIVLHSIVSFEQNREMDRLMSRLIEEAIKMGVVSPDRYHVKPAVDNKIAFKLVDRYDNPIYIGFKDGTVRIGLGVAYECGYDTKQEINKKE